MWALSGARNPPPGRQTESLMPLVLPFPDLSPELFTLRLGEFEFALRWYALAYIAGLLIAWRYAVWLLRRPGLWPAGTAPMAPERAEDLLTWCVLGVVLGGRLGYVVFYQPAHFLANPAEILAVWQGGMSFHGGMLGVLFAWGWWVARRGVPPFQLADMMCIVTPPGLFLGRLSNFANAELWGRPSALPWAVQFPGERAQACGQALGEVCARHPSQLYEALLEGLVLTALTFWLATRREWLKRPGGIAGIFLAGYGAARFLVELVRQPDPQFVSPGNPLGWALDLGGWGLTMGQILSLPMIALGLWLILRRREPVPA